MPFSTEVQKYLDDFLLAMNRKESMSAESDLMRFSAFLSEEAMKITFELNNSYHKPKEVQKLFSELIGKKVDKHFKLHPPFYTDCGKNIHIGTGVFINSCCNFQDQGGIYIGDNVQIGHNVVLVTLNHDKNPEERRTLHPLPIKIGNNVWIGSNVTILPGIEIGENAIIGAGSVVTKNVLANVTVAGNPAKIIHFN